MAPVNPYLPQSNPLAINPGELRHLIQIQTVSHTRDSSGQPIATWDLLVQTHARIENTGSRSYKESFSTNVLSAPTTDLITIRWQGPGINIKPGQRVVFGDNIYLIQLVDNVMRRNRVIRLACLAIDEDSN